MDWLKARAQAVADNVIGGLVLIGIAAAGGAIAVFGRRSVVIEWWEIIVLITVLVAIFGCLVALFRRGPVSATGGQTPTVLGPHAALLTRLASLEADLANGATAVGWPEGRLYNEMLSQAKSEIGADGLQQITWAEDSGTGYVTMGRASLCALVRQLRTIIEAST